VIQIGRDNAGDRSITSGDVVWSVGDGLRCHGYDTHLGNGIPNGQCSIEQSVPLHVI